MEGGEVVPWWVQPEEEEGCLETRQLEKDSQQVDNYKCFWSALLIIYIALIASYQGGLTCGAIDEPRKSSKAIDERVIINCRNKIVVIARFREKNVFW